MVDIGPGCKYFVTLCRKLFQLEKKFGYKAKPPSRGNAECTWRLKKGDSEVIFLVDIVETYGIPAIQFFPPERNDVFGLHEAVPAIDPEYFAMRPKDIGFSMTRKQLRELLEYWARFFHDHATEFLENPSGIVAAVKKFRRTKQDPFP